MKATANRLSNRKIYEIIFKKICFFTTWFSVLILIILLWHIISEGFDWLSVNLFTNFQSRFPHKAGVKAGICGTLWLISLTAVFSIPVGVASALFLEEYGVKGKIGKLIEINIANLAGVPSIVYGLLGLAVFVRMLYFEHSLLSGGLTLSLLIMPVIIVATRESIKAVPNSIRYAAYALGAGQWQVVFSHVLPIATSGILTGVILALSRAIGETAPLIIIGALGYVAFIPESPMDEFTILPMQIYGWASRPQPDFHSLAAGGIIVLLTVMISMNFIAVVIRNRSQKRNRL